MRPSDLLQRAAFVSLLDQIREVAGRQPKSTAIVSKEKHASYADLLARADGMASSFRNLGLLRGTGRVAVCTTDTIEMTVCALAAWICGCAYVPIDPAWPRWRTEHILTEAEVSILAFQVGLSRQAPVGAWQQIPIQNASESIDHFPAIGKQYIGIEPCQTAYIIYTSGSTGKPKGVAVAHRNLTNFCDWYRHNFRLSSEDRISQLAALTFDVSVGEIFPTLSAGACLCAGDRRIYASPEELYEFLVSQEITVSQVATVAVASLLKLPWPRETKMRSLQTGGDVLRVFPPQGLPFELVNLYGPTECTILVTAGVVPSGATGETAPSIGRPIRNANIYVLDENFQELPEGAQGEICIGGDCVALGYVGQSGLTSEKFVTRRFGSSTDRIYRTGDLGRKRSNGEYECLGRIDDQIKVLGLRIEPSEIVTAIEAHTAIAHAAIRTTGADEGKRLAAYVSLKGDCTADVLRAHLCERLPAYMVPAVFVRMDRMPLTPNGKIDVKALPAPDSFNVLPFKLSISEREPSELESKIIRLWEEVLEFSAIRADDDFFAIGGTSLRAARLCSRLETDFGTQMPVSAILHVSTPRKMAALVADQPSYRVADCVIPLSKKGEEKPLFLIHPISGNILSYRDLAAHLSCQPVYGIQARAFGDTSVENVAAEYLEQLRKIQEKGPYRLAGYSAGGIIAFEMARQLLDAGEQVGSLFLIDSRIERTVQELIRQGRVAEGVRLFYSLCKRDIRNIEENGLPAYIHWRMRRSALKTNLIEAYHRFACFWDVNSESVSALRVEAALLKAVEGYSPQSSRLDAVLFRSHESLRDNIDPTLGWKRLILGTLETYDLVGGHHTILAPDTASQLADILQEKLNVRAQYPRSESASIAFC